MSIHSVHFQSMSFDGIPSATDILHLAIDTHTKNGDPRNTLELCNECIVKYTHVAGTSLLPGWKIHVDS